VNPKELFGPLFEEANDKYPDADRAINELEWHPQHGLDETIRHTAEHIRSSQLASTAHFEG
jgi:nucleoside-diphosphate-sugar epimerase